MTAKTRLNRAKKRQEQRKTAAMLEQARLELIARQAAIIESSEDAIIVRGMDGSITTWNHGAQRLYGYTAEEILGKDISILYPPMQKDEMALILERIARGELINHYETIRVHQDGHLIDISLSISPVKDSAGTIIGAATIARDITDRKKYEKEIAFKNLLLSTQQETSIDGILVVDEKGKIISFNRRFQEMWKIPDTILISKSDQVALDWVLDQVAEPEKFIAKVEYLYKNKKEQSHEEIELRDGRIFDRYSAGMFGEKGEYFGRVWYFREITEERQAEQTLKDNEERLRLITETITEVFWMADPFMGHMYYISPAYEKIWGRTCESLYKNPSSFLESIHLDDKEKAAEHFRGQKSGESFDQEYRIIRPDGSTRWIWDRGFPVRGADGNVTHYVGIAQDITDKKLAAERLRSTEAQFLQAQKMESIGRLAGGVAHDFNNLLTAIQGYTEFLMSSLGATDPRREDALEIKKASERAVGLTRQLLAFSRQQVLAPKILDLNSVVLDIQKILKRVIGENIPLTFLPGKDIARVKADPGQIEQIIMNLSVNARDAMPEGGTITIETASTILDEEYARMHPGIKPGPFVQLSVSDTGTGMTAETLSHLFEPFFTTKEQGKGTGLGLATIYGIVQQSGGAISVYSELNHGTAFKIYFPAVDEAPEAIKKKNGELKSLAGDETILLVEDDETVRKFAQRVLAQHGYTVLAASNPNEAIALCEKREEPIDLLVTDVVMPTMPGYRLAERLLALHPEMKVIYMSGYTEHAVLQKKILATGSPFLQKPMTQEALAYKVRSVLNKAQAEKKERESGKDETGPQ